MIGSLRFHLRKDRVNKKGEAPIEIFYSIAGARQYVKSGLYVKPHNWDSDNYRGIYLDKKTAKKLYHEIDWKEFLTNVEIEDLNHELNKIEAAFIEIEKSFKNDTITSVMVIEKYKQGNLPKLEKPNSNIKENVFDFIDNYIRLHENTRAKGSMQVYKSLRTHLENFEATRAQKITFKEIDYNFFAEFRNFLLVGDHVRYYKKKNSNEFGKPMPYKLNDTTIAKQLSTLKTFLGYAKNQGIDMEEKYKSFSIKRHNLDITALTKDELQQIIDVDLSDRPNLDRIRDIFVFGCMTGLRVSDLTQLRRAHIKGNIIDLTVKKTKSKAGIPLAQKALEILEKYSDDEKPLPIISSQKINKYIKVVGKLAGINTPEEKITYYGSKQVSEIKPKYEFLTIHVARKTFASVAINKGMSTSIVKAIGGWKTEKAFARYVEVTQDAKEKAVNNIFDF